jgi:hypothetical protein
MQTYRAHGGGVLRLPLLGEPSLLAVFQALLCNLCLQSQHSQNTKTTVHLTPKSVC